MKKLLLCILLGLGTVHIIATFLHGAGLRIPILEIAASKSILWFWVSWVIFAILVVAAIFAITPKGQRKHLVRIRESKLDRVRGYLTKSKIVHVKDAAKYLYEYAGLADYIYDRDVSSQSTPEGWTKELSETLDKTQGDSGFHSELLSNKAKKVAAIVFRGTDEIGDSLSYLPEFVSSASNQYDIVESIAKPLMSEISSKQHLRGFKLFSVGHSLGGGLAQCLAYHASGGERTVEAVYAFNSTPIVGIKEPTLNKCVTVHHVFERGEVLAYLRSVYSETKNVFSNVRLYRFNFTKVRNPIYSHGMRAFSEALAEMKGYKIPTVATPDEQADQRRLIYDYIKFHIGLYLATPPIMMLLADGLGVEQCPQFVSSLVLMIVLFSLAGMHAGWFMGETINEQWHSDNLQEFEDRAFDPIRRFIHHWIYWAGLLVGIMGLFLSKIAIANGS